MDILLEEYSAPDQLFVRHAVSDAPDDRYYTMHVHSECEIYLFLGGRCDYLVEGSRYPLERGSILIMRPGESHRARILAPKQYERYVMNFPLSALDGTDPKRQLMTPFLNRPLGIGNLYSAGELPGLNAEQVFQKMFREAEGYDRELAMRTGLVIFLDALNEAFRQREDPESPEEGNISRRILLYINAHLCEELSLNAIAEEFYISRSQLTRIVKDATGSPVWEYITAKRLALAREKMLSGMTALRIAEECGFGDYSSFYRAYVRHYGHSPRETSQTHTNRSAGS